MELKEAQERVDAWIGQFEEGWAAGRAEAHTEAPPPYWKQEGHHDQHT